MSGPDVFGSNPYLSGLDVRCRVVLVLRGRSTNRGLRIEPFRSRAVKNGEIHELMLSDIDAGPDSMVDRVALLGFFEILEGGVITSRSQVLTGDKLLGRVIGFDQTHAPNHLNVCVYTPEFSDGEQSGLALDDEIVFRLPADG